jgi:hypothetical protein
MILTFGFISEMTLSMVLYLLAGIVGLTAFYTLLGLRYLPSRVASMMEKLWSPAGSIAEGRMMVVHQEISFRGAVLRGGFYFLFWVWNYRLDKLPLKILSKGSLGCMFKRNGEPLKLEQTLECATPCNNYHDAQAYCGRKSPRLPMRSYISGRISPNQYGVVRDRWCPNACSSPARRARPTSGQSFVNVEPFMGKM